MEETTSRKMQRLFRETRERATEKYGESVSRSMLVTGASGIAIWGLGILKLIVGIATLSLFICISAFYSFGMALARHTALAGSIQDNSGKERFRYYHYAILIMILASVIFVAYSVYLLFHPVNLVFHAYIAIGIAAFTFTEIVLNLRGVIKTRKDRDPCLHTMKAIHLASSLIGVVLTQKAILSFASDAVHIHPVANGVIGIAMGGLTILLGICILIRLRRIEAGQSHAVA